MAAKKKGRKFSREAWENLMATVKQEKAPEEPKKDPESSKVEVHIHNNVQAPEFSQGGNSADNDLKRMTGDNRRRWFA